MSKQPAELITLKELFEERMFIIPDYQRGYSWGRQQLIDLRKDIENLYGRGEEHVHYTGTIVAALGDKEGSALEVVDGQQRMTSLVILLRAIYVRDPQKYAAIEEHYIERGGAGNEELVVRPNEETDIYFRDRVLAGKVDTPTTFKSHENIHTACIFFQEWLEEAHDRIDQILHIITHRLGFIFFVPRDHKEIGIMFEVINNRGKELSQLEKMKNYFIYYATVMGRKRLHERINRRWSSLLKHLSLARLTSNADEDGFLRNCYLVHYEVNKEHSWDVYAQMKERYKGEEAEAALMDAAGESIDRFVEFIESASRYASWFYRDKELLKGQTLTKDLIEVDRKLRYLRCHPVDASVMPLYFAIMHREASWADKARLLKVLEVLNFRLYVLPKVLTRADSKQGELFELGHAYFHCTSVELHRGETHTPHLKLPLTGSAVDRLIAYLSDMVMYYCPEVKVVQALTLDQEETDNYHRWNGLRFLLACYEEHLNAALQTTFDIQDILKGRGSFGTLPNDHLSVEHIWAQKNLPKEYPPDHRDKRRLGNLVLLGMRANTSISNDGITEKMKELADTNSTNKVALKLEQIVQLLNLLPRCEEVVKKRRTYKNAGYFHDLSRAISDARETELIRFALERWKLDGEVFQRFVNVDSFHAEENRLKENYRLANGQPAALPATAADSQPLG